LPDQGASEHLKPDKIQPKVKPTRHRQTDTGREGRLGLWWVELRSWGLRPRGSRAVPRLLFFFFFAILTYYHYLECIEETEPNQPSRPYMACGRAS
jgi:hypothetical protein